MAWRVAIKQSINTSGLLPLCIATIVLPIMFWHGLSTYSHRQRLVRDNVTVEAVVEKRIFKHCYGLRCSDPEFFAGQVGSDDYHRFADRCGKYCWRLLRYQLVWRTVVYHIYESVKYRKFEQTPVGSHVKVYVDQIDPNNSQMVGTTANESAYAGPIVLGGFWVVLAFLGFSIALGNRVKERHTFGGPRY